MGVSNSQLTTNFSDKYQLTTNFGELLSFTFLQQILFCHNPNFLYFSTSITSGGRPYLNHGIN